MALDTSVAVIQYPSLVQWLADRLGGAIAAHHESANFPTQIQHPASATLEPRATVPSDLMPLPLFTPSAQQFGTFSCTVLLQLSKGAGTATVQTLGEELLQHFVDQTLTNELKPKLWVHPKGWLYAYFDAENLAKWLQSLMMAKPILVLGEPRRGRVDLRSPISPDPLIFGLQHAHARCCSLLRLAQQESVLPPNDLEHFFMDSRLALWQTDSGELRLQTKAERGLLLALMQFPQSLSPQKMMYGCCNATVPGAETRVSWILPQTHLSKQAMVWSQLFADFHRDCRLFGDVQKNTPQLAEARFALIYVVKKVLAFLLEEILQGTAPITL
jgi:DALR anticodon binding domain